MSEFRSIPSIEQLVSRPTLDHAASQHGRDVVLRAARDAASELRLRFADDADTTMAPDAITAWLESRTLALTKAHARPSLRRVINATGVIIHTNLGRAPLAEAAAKAAALIATGYSNLEFDLDRGNRGHRHVHAERLLCSLTGAEAAVIVNNAAAAALLALKALGAGREVIVSRGELVEIGGGFRVPEILAQSGAILREVGTTNRTRIADYAAAINDRTGLILRVHPSNFQIQGFTERPLLPDLMAVARRFNIRVVEDLGSGWLGVTPAPESIADEPSVRSSLAAGVDLVVFSGDKLLGGPQAGIVVGRRNLVGQLRGSPLMRALRADKLTYAAMINKAGKTVQPTIEAFQAAASNADWAKAPGYYVILTDQPGEASWPITAATFILMHKAATDKAAAQEAIKFFKWSFEKGGKMAEELDYIPMPEGVVKLIEKTWSAEIKS